MKIFELNIKVYLLEDIKLNDCANEISSLVDKSFLKDSEFKKFHEENKFKHYSIGGFTPVERGRVFKKGGIYEFKLRTPDKGLMEYLFRNLSNEYTDKIKILVIEEKVIPRKHIEKIYTLTPAIAKFEKGYWKDQVGFDEYEDRIKINLIKKYNDFTKGKIDEGFVLYNRIELNNEYPIPVEYKGIKLLGDKVTLFVENNETAQELAYFALGVGLLEMNTRMCGFIGYKYL